MLDIIFENSEEFIHCNYLCAVKKNMIFGCWEGYIKLPKTHMDYGKDHTNILNIYVYGGLNYSCDGVFGFSCNSPRNKKYIKTQQFIKDEVKSLAKQFYSREKRRYTI